MGQGGRIINLSSLATKGAANMAAYAGSKAFVEGLTRSLALEFGPRGITVNAVSPGATETEMFAPMLPMKEYVVSRTPLGRLGQADDIASVVAFLAGAEAGWVTGQVIGVDGALSF
jgi:3-oxoacyl-[acyl-carrier protein] reductase